MSLWTPPILFADRIGIFYFRLLFLEELFSLSRKVSNAITRLPKAHNNVNMLMKIEIISKAVIHATSLLMYSGKPVIQYWEAAPPCHGYFPMAYAMQIIYHFFCHNSIFFVKSFVIRIIFAVTTLTQRLIYAFYLMQCILPVHLLFLTLFLSLLM